MGDTERLARFLTPLPLPLLSLVQRPVVLPAVLLLLLVAPAPAAVATPAPKPPWYDARWYEPP
jgi:hypothetical protein